MFAVILLLVTPLVSQAASVTKQYQITLSSASGLYDAGHVFRITASYDDASYGYSDWDDGPDGKADFGADDDLLRVFVATPVPTSDVAISISGLLPLPTGLVAADVHMTNYSVYYTYKDPFQPAIVYDGFELRADDLFFALLFGGSGHSIVISQYFTDPASGQTGDYATFLDPRNSSLQVLASVPEPSALTLLGLGLAGLLVFRKHR